jgi:hypothetical protein
MLKRLPKLFSGFEKAHGVFIPEGFENGKYKGKCSTVKEKITLDLWREHLRGATGLGISPLKEDGTCSFGAIDIDDYSLDIPAILKKISDQGLQLSVTKSKSGGIHCWVFYESPVPSKKVRALLTGYARILGYPTTEIFPKQEGPVEEGNIPNWINMPFFGETRKGLDKNGEEVDFDFWYESIKLVQAEEPRFVPFHDGPICLQRRADTGVGAGERNEVLHAMGVYAQKKYGEGFREILAKCNSRFIKPPISASEFSSLSLSLMRKEYSYPCKKSCLATYCDKAKCRTMKYGVGEHEGMPSITGLTKHDTDPPVWEAQLEGGKTLVLSTEALQSQVLFQKAAIETLNVYPPDMKRDAWKTMISALLENVTVLEVAEDMTAKGKMRGLVEMYATQISRALNLLEIVKGKPFTLDGYIYFTAQGFSEFLSARREKYSLSEINTGLLQIGAKAVTMGNLKAWCITEPEQINLGTPDSMEAII